MSNMCVQSSILLLCVPFSGDAVWRRLCWAPGPTIYNGSADMWVPSATCTMCASANWFNDTNSSTFSTTNDSYTVRYGSGVIYGRLSTDEVRIGEYFLPRQKFLLVDKQIGLESQFQHMTWGLSGSIYSSEAAYQQDAQFDGIVGLALPRLSEFGGPVLSSLLEDEQMPSNMFAVDLTAKMNGGTSSLVLGGLDDEVCDISTLHWARGISDIYWMVQGDITVVNRHESLPMSQSPLTTNFGEDDTEAAAQADESVVVMGDEASRSNGTEQELDASEGDAVDGATADGAEEAIVSSVQRPPSEQSGQRPWGVERNTNNSGSSVVDRGESSDGYGESRPTGLSPQSSPPSTPAASTAAADQDQHRTGPFAFQMKGQRFILDTGTSFLAVPQDHYQDFVASLFPNRDIGSQCLLHDVNGIWTCRCPESDPVLRQHLDSLTAIHLQLETPAGQAITLHLPWSMLFTAVPPSLEAFVEAQQRTGTPPPSFESLGPNTSNNVTSEGHTSMSSRTGEDLETSTTNAVAGDGDENNKTPDEQQAEQPLCTLELVVRPDESPDWILGATFLQRYLTIFDMDNARIGFAHKRDMDYGEEATIEVHDLLEESSAPAQARSLSVTMQGILALCWATLCGGWGV